MDAIYTRGWVIVDDFLTAAEVDALKACLPSEWQPAGIGRDALHQGNPDIRRDQIHWLEPSSVRRWPTISRGWSPCVLPPTGC